MAAAQTITQAHNDWQIEHERLLKLFDGYMADLRVEADDLVARRVRELAAKRQREGDTEAAQRVEQKRRQARARLELERAITSANAANDYAKAARLQKELDVREEMKKQADAGMTFATPSEQEKLNALNAAIAKLEKRKQEAEDSQALTIKPEDLQTLKSTPVVSEMQSLLNTSTYTAADIEHAVSLPAEARQAFKAALRATETETQAKAESATSGAVYSTELAKLTEWPQIAWGIISQSLPGPVTTLTTDADGRCAGKVPTEGNYVFAANLSRLVGTTAEHTCWLVRVDFQDAMLKKVFLSNTNTFVSSSPENVFVNFPQPHGIYH